MNKKYCTFVQKVLNDIESENILPGLVLNCIQSKDRDWTLSVFDVLFGRVVELERGCYYVKLTWREEMALAKALEKAKKKQKERIKNLSITLREI